MKFPIDEIWIDDDAAKHPVTSRITSRVKPRKVVSGIEIRNELAAIDLLFDPLYRGKRILKLTNYKGSFVKPCPGTRQYNCCGLQILNIGQG